MRNKKAKALRKAAYSIPGLPDVDYKEVNVYEGHKMYIGPNGPTISADPIRTSTVVLAYHCRRSWYQSMKRGRPHGD